VVSAIAGSFVGYRGVWVFYTAPFVGAGAAALLTSIIFGLDDEVACEDDDAPSDIQAIAGNDRAKLVDERTPLL
jgi:hypothetical protein